MSLNSNIYKKIDKIYSLRSDYTFCNSKTTQHRLLLHLNQNTKIISPGIDTKYYIPSTNPTNDYFLIVSRLVPHKNIDYVIKTFNKLNKKLIIVGSGRDEIRLKNLVTSSNIFFAGQVNDQQLLKYYQNCIALICPQIEDYGLVSLEAQSCGRPVIAYNKGGITETVNNNVTGILFNHQNKMSLINSISKFYKTKFDSNTIRNHAKKFDESIFMVNFKNEINKIWENKYL